MNRIIFCDFDGIITAEETFVGMLRQFATQSYDDIKNRILNRQINLRDGVRSLVESIPSERYSEVLSYVRTKPIRKGFSSLLDLCRQHQIPFVVISGGLLDSVKTRLSSYADKITSIHAASVDTTGPFLKLISEYESDEELVSKPKVTKIYTYDESAVIGDGITDVSLAQIATVVFARDLLAQYLDTKKQPYVKWRNFRNIRIPCKLAGNCHCKQRPYHPAPQLHTT